MKQNVKHANERDRSGRNIIIHDEDFGEDNVEMVDNEWADFERFLRYLICITFSVNLF